MNGSFGNLDETHELAPINNDRVPFRYILGVKKLDSEIDADELLYLIITKSLETEAYVGEWPDGTNMAMVPVKFSNLHWLGHSTIIKGCENYKESIETLVKLKYIIKKGNWYRIVNHPWK